ncbi:MAG: DUF1801 domain-containing protein [Anaerolineales bacterium]|nr:DUF1801 domain-containing protein [Anaerolineales bacterium]
MGNADRPFSHPQVAEIFAGYPEALRQQLLGLRQLIFEVAGSTADVGPIEETLKWGQPSYLTSQTGSGTTIRIDQLKKQPGHFAIFTHCQTPLVDNFRQKHGDAFSYDKNRAIIFSETDQVPHEKISEFIRSALTYHLK